MPFEEGQDFLADLHRVRFKGKVPGVIGNGSAVGTKTIIEQSGEDGLLGHFQNEIERGEVKGVRFSYFKKQIRAKQRIGRVSGFSWKVELRAEDGSVGGLQTHVVMTGPSRIQTWDDGFERVATTGI